MPHHEGVYYDSSDDPFGDIVSDEELCDYDYCKIGCRYCGKTEYKDTKMDELEEYKREGFIKITCEDIKNIQKITDRILAHNGYGWVLCCPTSIRGNRIFTGQHNETESLLNCYYLPIKDQNKPEENKPEDKSVSKQLEIKKLELEIKKLELEIMKLDK